MQVISLLKPTLEKEFKWSESDYSDIVVAFQFAYALGMLGAGRIIDKDFLKDLPENVDACGENGEFHTFVFDGPIFKKPVDIKIGEKIFRRSFTLGLDITLYIENSPESAILSALFSLRCSKRLFYYHLT